MMRGGTDHPERLKPPKPTRATGFSGLAAEAEISRHGAGLEGGGLLPVPFQEGDG